jgi:hypothetical protein
LAEPIPTGLADITHYRPPSSLADKMAYLLAGTNTTAHLIDDGRPLYAPKWNPFMESSLFDTRYSPKSRGIRLTSHLAFRFMPPLLDGTEDSK